MKIGLVGYQGSGKSTLFEWLTQVRADPGLAHTIQSAMAPVPDPRVPELCQIYHPKKITLAALEIIDTPGLRGTHEGNATRLAAIREAGCLLVVVAAFDGSDPWSDLRRFQEDLLLADFEIISGRVQRLEEALKKPRPNREQQQEELDAIRPLLSILESGRPLTDVTLNEEQSKAVRSFQLLTQKPQLAIVNVADDVVDLAQVEAQAPATSRVVAIPIGLESELARMEPADRDAFREEMGLASFDRDALLRLIMDASGQTVFLTAGEKEVRTWMIPQGATALQAADSIHSDLARGFIRAEIMSCSDLLRLGSEREVKAHNLVRSEPKDYVLRDGDILNIRFSV